MSDVFLLSESQMKRIEPFFPLAHGVPRVDDRRVLSGIVYVIRNGLQWKDAPKAYGPHKTLYNRFIRWSHPGVFDRIFKTLAEQGRPVRLHLTAGQVSDFKGADVLLADLPDKTEEIIGDRGYDSNRIRLLLAERTITACIPPKKNRKYEEFRGCLDVDCLKFEPSGKHWEHEQLENKANCNCSAKAESFLTR